MIYLNCNHVAFLSLCVLMIACLVLWPTPLPIVTFNAEEVRGKLIRQLAEHAASNAQVQKTSTAFKLKLNAVLVQYAKSHHVVIVDSSTVLAGARDITADLLLNLSKSKRGQS